VCARQSSNQLVLAQRRQHQVPTDVDDLGGVECAFVDVAGRQRGVCSKRMEVAAILADDGKDHGLRCTKPSGR
jgi:hypothetical protein